MYSRFFIDLSIEYCNFFLFCVLLLSFFIYLRYFHNRSVFSYNLIIHVYTIIIREIFLFYLWQQKFNKKK